MSAAASSSPRRTTSDCPNCFSSVLTRLSVVAPDARFSILPQRTRSRTLDLLRRAEADHPLDAGSVVSAAVEDDEAVGRGSGFQRAWNAHGRPWRSRAPWCATDRDILRPPPATTDTPNGDE